MTDKKITDLSNAEDIRISDKDIEFLEEHHLNQKNLIYLQLTKMELKLAKAVKQLQEQN